MLSILSPCANQCWNKYLKYMSFEMNSGDDQSLWSTLKDKIKNATKHARRRQRLKLMARQYVQGVCNESESKKYMMHHFLLSEKVDLHHLP